mgnify:CR=1 FL=1
MATMETSGDLQRVLLQQADALDDATIKAALEAGASMLEQAVKRAFVAAGHYRPGAAKRTGETLAHITHTRRVKRDKDKNPYLEVIVTGADARQQRYGVKAFVLNYGRRRRGGIIKPDWYWSTAVKDNRDRVNAAMAEIIAGKLEGGD